MLLGIDTGGTFTDFVLLDGERLRVHKVLSTPHAPEQAILQGVRELGLTGDGLASLQLVHGSTVATNAVLEGKGGRTCFITNHGLQDLLTIGRQARRELYNLQPQALTPPVPRELCLETGGRLGGDGAVVEPLGEEDLAALVARVKALAPEAVAITLLFSFLDDRFERQIEAALPAGLFVSRSSAILPEYKEYERGIATWLNAWVGPLVAGYLQRLEAGLPGVGISVMQSCGNTIEAGLAGRQAVRMLLSGPAGGLSAARAIAARTGREQLLTFDMGGTSTDVALIDGELRLTSEGRIGPWPVAVPMVDMHTIGAGGGSIARVDGGGLLQVGPQSAGAAPGPACYGRGGVEATVTDANLLLGRLRADAFLGGEMALDVAAAKRAVGVIAEQLNIGLYEAAEGIIRIANEQMARALRVISVQRGIDPRQLTLACFGGAGGLHVCALAEALGMRQALVPIHGGVLSALGMLSAPRGRQLSCTHQGLLQTIPVAEIEQALEGLRQQGMASLAQEGVTAAAVTALSSIDLRYKGQSYTLNVAWHGDVAEASEAFHLAHQQRYGHRLALPVELVNLRLSLRGPLPQLPLEAPPVSPGGVVVDQAVLHGIDGPVALYRRQDLSVGNVIEGPALVTEQVATTFIAPHWRALVDPHGNLVLDCQA
ncbi:MAG: hydantoinase/oxoprolinase family protein [Gammaproteobacteria bacterium]|nr:hydantoinase/oxoprolinase family protein [Gammaproteobacteria bacterium]